MPSDIESAGAIASLFHAAPCGVLRTRADGTITLVNQTFCTWTGFQSDELVGGMKFRDLLTVGGRIFHQTHWLPLMQMQGSISEIKLDIVKSDGEAIPMVINAVMHHEEGEAFQLIATFIARDRDKYERELLTARKRLQRSVEEAKRLQEVATDRALLAEQMIGIVSHDLRNPLGTLTLGAELLGDANVAEPQEPVLARMRRASDRANRLISDLLDFTEARLAGGLSVSISTCDLHDAVASATEELRSLYPAREIWHRRDGEGPCDADTIRLTQLIGNLVSNAIAYGAEDVPVTMTSSVADGTCTLAVHNEGEPIAAEMQETIFSPMKRASSVPNTTHNIGLGLYIVKMIADAHGGTVRVESDESIGTTFIVTFPAEREESDASSAPDQPL